MEQEGFLQQFETSSWSGIELGRVAVPRLQGGPGLWLCYLGETSEIERVASVQCIAAGMADKQKVITVIFGDINLSENHADRFQQQSGLWSGTANEVDARVWQQMIIEQDFAE